MIQKIHLVDIKIYRCHTEKPLYYLWCTFDKSKNKKEKKKIIINFDPNAMPIHIGKWSEKKGSFLDRL